MTPVIALDFASLYPSIIMAHNLSPENVIEDEDILTEEPIAGSADFLVTVKGMSNPVQCCKVLVEFENAGLTAQINSYVLARSEGVGIYPAILRMLFDMRKEVKKQLEHLEEQIKECAKDSPQQRELIFQASLIDAKQKAIKVFMNTFYGETGN